MVMLNVSSVHIVFIYTTNYFFEDRKELINYMSKFEAVCLCVGLKICKYQPIFCHVCVAWKWQLSNHKLLCNPIDSV